MHTTTGGTIAGPPAASSSPLTADAEAKHTASAPATATRSAAVRGTGTVR